MEPRIVLARVLHHLAQYQYRTATEAMLGDGIAQVLEREGLAFSREHIDGHARFDFLVEGAIVIELKTDGSFAEAMRQIEAYCQRDTVAGVVVATQKHWAGGEGAMVLAGKPVHVIRLRGHAF